MRVEGKTDVAQASDEFPRTDERCSKVYTCEHISPFWLHTAVEGSSYLDLMLGAAGQNKLKDDASLI